MKENFIGQSIKGIQKTPVLCIPWAVWAHFTSRSVTPVLRLLGQRVVPRRDAGKMEKILID